MTAPKTITLWGRRNAFSVQKVLWLLAELDLPFALIDSGGPHGSLDTAEFLALNPAAKLPVIDDDGAAVWESNTILRYLAARYAPDRFWPQDPHARSLADRWMDWSLATLEPAFQKLFWGYFRTPEAARNQAFIDAAIAECGKAYGLLDRVLAERSFLAEDGFGLGDIAAGASLYRYHSLDLPRPALPHLGRWYERLGERPAFRSAIMRPFDELKGRLV